MSTLGNKTTGGFSTISKQSLTGDGGTSYTLQQSVNNENELEVYVNNTRQEPTTAYTAQGTTLTMTGAVNASDSFYVIFQGKAVVSQEGIFGNSSTRFTSDNVTIGGTLAVTGDVSVDTDTLKVDVTNDKVGINTASPDGTLHVHSASAGSVTPQTAADDIVVENNGHGGMSVLTPDANRSAIVFGHASDNHKMQIRHDGGTSLSQVISDDALTFNVGDGTERMRIDANGNITKPSNPSFRAMGTNAAYQTTSPIPFNSVSGSGGHNIGSHYNTSNYRFTAPVAGRYLFHVHVGIINITAGGGLGYPYLRINGTAIAYSYYQMPASATYLGGFLTQIFSLSANDYVDVTWAGGNSQYYGNYTELSFSGCLIG